MSIRIYFNPLDRACKSVTGAVKQGKSFQLNVFLLKNDAQTDAFGVFTPNEADCLYPEHDAFLSFNRDGEAAQSFPMQKTAFGWTIALSVPEIGLYYYTFYIDGQGFVSCNEMTTGELDSAPRGFLLTVYSKNYRTPEWFKGGVMYQIFPDRFYKEGTMPDIKGRISRNDWGGIPSYRPNEHGKVLNNDFFGGNFKGIIKKLPYLKKLGVTVIYFNPIFEAASNHRYDTSDYMKIDPILGTEQDFKKLIETAENNGIRVILDGVFNHTGDNSVYFNKYGKYPSLGAYQSKDSPYYSWYSFEEFPDKYASWWGIDILPEVNEESKEYQEFIFGEKGVLKKWLSFGIGGYRLDVADELPDFFLKNLRKSVKESNENAIIIGEVWEDAAEKIAYSKRREYLQGYELDSVMNYPLKEAIISYIKSENAWKLLQTLRTLIDHYPKQTVDCLMNILGTHDTARILTVLGGIYCQNKEEMASESAYLSATAKEKAIEKLKMAAILQYTLPGIPCVYYGDENGAEGHIDPFCRQCFDWDNLNEDLLLFYENLGGIRKRYRNIFKDGEFKTLFVDDGLIFYKRKKAEREIYIYVNNSGKPYQFELSKRYKNVLTNEIYEIAMQIQPYSYGIFIQEQSSRN
ncbi:MAG: glycoside hydrolase family 13 protein [Clostridia bacterium]|nr:glycoside hydrolase family 13 protein [Clostridia bacterium]